MTDQAQDAPAAPDIGTADTRRFGSAYRAVLLSLVLLVSAFAYIDRVLLQTLAQPIKEDLNLSDFQLGLLAGLGFAIFYSTLGLPIARLAERRNRITIISVSVAIFSGFALLCGLAGNFLQMFLCRIGVGIGEAGVQSPATSLISDHFEPQHRGFAFTVMRYGAPVGSIFGSVLGAWIAKEHGWRTALVVMALPGVAIALLFRLVLREPPRGLSDPGGAQAKAAAAPPAMRTAFAAIFSRPAFRHMLIGLGLATMGLYAAAAFTVPFFIRVLHRSLPEAGVYNAVLTVTSSVVGMGLGGFGIDFIARRGKQWYALLPALGLLIAAPLYLAGYFSVIAPLSLAFVTVGGTFLFLHSVPTLVALQNMVEPNMRATAAFVYFFISTLVGVGFGPPLAGLISDAYASAALGGGSFTGLCPGHHLTGACAAASAIGVRNALATSVGLLVWAALHYAIAARHLVNEARAAAR